MLKELHILGIYLPPILLYLLLAALPWLLIRWLLTITRAYRLIWHPPLFNTALYILLLAATYYIITLDPRPAPVAIFVNLLRNLFT